MTTGGFCRTACPVATTNTSRCRRYSGARWPLRDKTAAAFRQPLPAGSVPWRLP